MHSIPVVFCILKFSFVILILLMDSGCIMKLIAFSNGLTTDTNYYGQFSPFLETSKTHVSSKLE